MLPHPTLSRRVLSVAVGLFVLWELIYLPAANVIDFVPRRLSACDKNPSMDPFQEEGTFTTIEPLQRSVEAIGSVLDFWSDASGQEQGWSLFAPGTPAHSIFPAVEFRFPDGTTETVRSRFEPPDLTNPGVRAPLIHHRMYNFEIQFALPGWYCNEESLEQHPYLWSVLFPKTVRDDRRHILRWLSWHLREFQRAYPDRELPTEVVLKYRYVPSPLPREPRGWTNKPVIERPYCRWKPGTDPEPGYLPLEGYNLVTNQFVRLTEASQ